MVMSSVREDDQPNSPAQPAAMLEARELAVGYREGIDILQGVSLSVSVGSITSIIGPNGAGKSTLLKCLFGLTETRTPKSTRSRN